MKEECPLLSSDVSSQNVQKFSLSDKKLKNRPFGVVINQI